jgi:chromosome segregation ATPase
MPAIWMPSLTSVSKRFLVIRGTRTLFIAVTTVLMGLGQAAAQPASERLDLREAPGPMRPVEETRAIEAQQNTERLPAGFHDTLQAADELAAALSTANERFAALVGRTKTAATDLYWQLQATRRQRDELSAALVDVQARLRVRQSHEKELAGRVVALGEEVRQSEAEIAGLSLALEASEQQRRRLEQVGQEVAQMKDELLGLRHLLMTANAALARVQAERDAARAETEALRAEATALLNAALASLQRRDQAFDTSPGAGPAVREHILKAPITRSPETRGRRDARF